MFKLHSEIYICLHRKKNKKFYSATITEHFFFFYNYYFGELGENNQLQSRNQLNSLPIVTQSSE